VQCPTIVIGTRPANVAARARPVKHRTSTLGDRRIDASGRLRGFFVVAANLTYMTSVDTLWDAAPGGADALPSKS
jgi:hypothetical protein